MYKDAKELIQSKSFQGIIIGIVIAIIVLLIFQAGMTVGYRKAAFSLKYGDNYYRIFGSQGGQRQAVVGFRGDLMGAHGAAGRIVSINLPTFVVADPENAEKVVLINDKTVIRRFDESLEPADLKVDDFAVVLGSPNEDSQIESTLIRILPFPPENGMRIKIRQ